MANISFYGSHNSAIAIENEGKYYIIEFERFLNVKNIGYAQYFIARTRPYLLKYVLDWVEKEYGIKEYDNCYYLNTDTIEGDEKVFYEKLIKANNYEQLFHHKAHASSGFYQSNYDEALILSFDGGGNDGFFNIYHAKNRKEINEIDRLNIDMGFPYMYFGEYINDIKREPDLSLGNLVYSGKLMGLCSYGNIIDEWITPIKDFYYARPNGITAKELFTELLEKIDITLEENGRISGQSSWDLVKTSQFVFEEITLELIQPYLNQYPDIPIILVGGCALNIIFNTRLLNETKRDVFVPPNPNDCGIASGLLFDKLKPEYAVDLTYAGIPILDENLLMSYLETIGCNWIKYEFDDIVNFLNNGKIIGVVRGNSEHGPRALGNRSILCNPTYPNMKDILNMKVKNREWYRPFAPVVRLEDVNKYFEFDYESRWMSFCPKVREEWQEKLISITHTDGTARVQTVTKEQNEWLYNLLTEFEKVTGVGVLLNTSFNVDSKPILSTYNDALKVFNDTALDGLILKDFFIHK